MKSLLLKIILPAMVITLAATGISMAQPGGGGPVPGPGNGGGPGGGATDVPIDGGVSLLLAGGVAYGVKHLRNRRRKA
jgi:hypothetical protein